MRFLVDRNVPKQIARLLNEYDPQHTVEYLDDHFPPDAADVDWIEAAGQWNPPPIIIGGDSRILANPAEAQALREAELSFFVLQPGWTNIAFHDQKWKAVKVFPHILDAAEGLTQPTVFRVPVGATGVTLDGPTHQL